MTPYSTSPEDLATEKSRLMLDMGGPPLLHRLGVRDRRVRLWQDRPGFAPELVADDRGLDLVQVQSVDAGVVAAQDPTLVLVAELRQGREQPGVGQHVLGELEGEELLERR